MISLVVANIFYLTRMFTKKIEEKYIYAGMFLVGTLLSILSLPMSNQFNLEIEAEKEVLCFIVLIGLFIIDVKPRLRSLTQAGVQNLLALMVIGNYPGIYILVVLVIVLLVLLFFEREESGFFDGIVDQVFFSLALFLALIFFTETDLANINLIESEFFGLSSYSFLTLNSELFGVVSALIVILAVYLIGKIREVYIKHCVYHSILILFSFWLGLEVVYLDESILVFLVFSRVYHYIRKSKSVISMSEFYLLAYMIYLDGSLDLHLVLLFILAFITFSSENFSVSSKRFMNRTLILLQLTLSIAAFMGGKEWVLVYIVLLNLELLRGSELRKYPTPRRVQE